MRNNRRNWIRVLIHRQVELAVTTQASVWCVRSVHATLSSSRAITWSAASHARLVASGVSSANVTLPSVCASAASARFARSAAPRWCASRAVMWARARRARPWLRNASSVVCLCRERADSTSCVVSNPTRLLVWSIERLLMMLSSSNRSFRDSKNRWDFRNYE